MRARAAWRSRPDDPRALPGWFVSEWDAGAKLVAQEAAWSMRLFGALAIMRGEFGLGFILATVFAFSPEAIVGSVIDLVRRRWQPATRRFAAPPLGVSDLLTLPPPATPYPCSAGVCNRSTLLGRDMGIVTFVDGWLHFEGRRTSFSLRRSDVARLSDERLELFEGGAVEFEPQDGLIASGLLERNLVARFKTDMKRWMRDDPPTGEPILPPVLAHASGFARAWGNLGASLLVGGAWAAVLLHNGFPLGALVLTLPFGLGALRSAIDLRRVGPAPKALRRREGAALEREWPLQ